MTSGVVEQLGMDTMPSCQSRSSPLTSGTTRGTAGSMRKALESSITSAPALAATGPKRRESSVRAEMKAMSTSEKLSSVVVSTVNALPFTSSLRPAERLDARSFRL